MTHLWRSNRLKVRRAKYCKPADHRPARHPATGYTCFLLFIGHRRQNGTAWYVKARTIEEGEGGMRRRRLYSILLYCSKPNSSYSSSHGRHGKCSSVYFPLVRPHPTLNARHSKGTVWPTLFLFFSSFPPPSGLPHAAQVQSSFSTVSAYIYINNLVASHSDPRGGQLAKKNPAAPKTSNCTVGVLVPSLKQGTIPYTPLAM